MSDIAALPPLRSEGAFSSLMTRTGRSIGAIMGPVIGLVLVMLIFGLWEPERFLSPRAISNVLRNNYHFAVAAIGMTFVVVTAGIDLSAGSTMALACVCCAYVMKGFELPAVAWRERTSWAQLCAPGGVIAVIVGLCVAGRMLRAGAGRWKALGVTLLMVLLSGALTVWLCLLVAAEPHMPWYAHVPTNVAIAAASGLFALWRAARQRVRTARPVSDSAEAPVAAENRRAWPLWLVPLIVFVGVLIVLMCLGFLGARKIPAARWTWIAILAGILSGALVGVLNGLLITSLELPPFIVTLATLEAVRGAALYITDAIPVSLPVVRDPVTGQAGGIQVLTRSVFDLSKDPEGIFQRVFQPLMAKLVAIMPTPYLKSLVQGLVESQLNVWLALAVVIVAVPLLHFTVLGRYAYAIGSNERTARLCGVPVDRYKSLTYVIAGALAGLAGVMMTAKFNGGFPDEFRGAELTVIAAVVIGGTSLFGGEGTVLGSVLGVLMLGFLYSGCVIANISPHIQRMFIGGMIVLAAAADRFRHLGR